MILPVLKPKPTGKKKAAVVYELSRKIPDPSYSLSEIVRPHVPKSPKQQPIDEQFPLFAIEEVLPEEAQPFLKWVGGKAQLLEQFDKFFPEQIDRYVEPFVGGGAVFFPFAKSLSTDASISS